MFNDVLMVSIKGFMSLIFLFLVIKLLGKKQISQLNIFDYVIGISLGNLAAEMTINKDISIVTGFLAMTIYGLCSLFVSFITRKSILARRFISGTHVVLMEHGKISKENLKKVKINLNDLMQDAREDGIFDLSKVDYAIMEVSGKVTFLLKSANQPVTREDLNINISDDGLTANLILDGKIMVNNLEKVGKSVSWLKSKIELEGYKEFKEILLLLYDGSKVTIYDRKYKVKKEVLE